MSIRIAIIQTSISSTRAGSVENVARPMSADTLGRSAALESIAGTYDGLARPTPLEPALSPTPASEHVARVLPLDFSLRDLRDHLRTQHLAELRKLAADHVSIAVFPEMADLPFSLMTEKEVLLDVATQLSRGEDLFFTELRDLSDKTGMIIVFPTLERDTRETEEGPVDQLYSSAFVIMPQASVIEVVRKRLRAREEGLFEKDVLGGYDEPGFQIFGNDEFRFAVTMDRGGVFFRTAEMLAQEAQSSLIINPRAQLHSDSQRILDEELRDHARRHQYSLALANRVGERESVGEAFSGLSRIIGANGEVLAMGSGDQPEVLHSTLSFEHHLFQVTPGLTVASEDTRIELHPKELH